MSVYAISDLHLSFSEDKPMEKFGDIWIDHANKIKDNWMKKVKQEDSVVIVGDISWSLHLENTIPDFKFLEELPGTKYFIKGNHDYWWGTKKKMEEFFEENNFNSIKIINNSCTVIEDKAICGLRGWGKTQDATGGSRDDKKIYKRECMRLENCLKTAKEINATETIVAMHFPPMAYLPFKEILEKYQVDLCIYGHLHGDGLYMVKEGNIKNVNYKMVSCDYTKFDLIEI